MSKFSDQVKATILNRKMPAVSSLVSYSIDYSRPPDSHFYGVAYKVNFGAKFGVDLIISEDLFKDDFYKDYILKNIKRTLIEEIFGEFRTPIREIYVDIMKEDREAAVTKLLNLEKQMFDV